MSRHSILKTSLAAAAVGFGITAAVLSLSTTAPQSAHADIPPAMIAAPTTGGLPSLAPMLRETMPAVVNISVTSKVAVQNPFGPMMEDPNFRRFFGVPDQPQQREAQSLGSGTIVDAARGYILTNAHVIADADEIKVRLSDDREFAAKLIGKDADSDLAVIQIKAERLKALSLGNSDSMQIGDFVVAIGSPFGLRQTATTGIVSGLGRANNPGAIEDFIQTDASINPGNSGGALINLRGELIGVPSQILSRSGGNIGIGFAIPVNLAKSVMSQLIETGSVTRGRIGVQGQDITPELAKSFGLPTARGVVVSRVVPKGQADKAGLKVEDIILRANGREVTDFAQLRTVIGLLRVGDKVSLDILRDSKPKTIQVTVGKDSDAAASGAAANAKLQGASFTSADESNSDGGARGVVVARIEPRSPAARTGLRQGDIVIGVNRKPVNDMEEFGKLTQGDGPLLLHVRRGEGALFLLVQ
ncbi:MAG: DegQ family serine endoprotease [Pseudomonadota bacterium]